MNIRSQLLFFWTTESLANAMASRSLTDEDRALVRRFTGIYATHIPLEETLAYPAAQALLEPQPLAEMGAEMAARRKSK